MGLWTSFKRRVKYFTAKSDSRFNERADPKVQLEQAIGEAQDQHRRLKDQAASVIANQKQAELRLNRQMGEYEKLTANTRQAVLMADQATKAGDAAKAGEYTAAAESFANRLIAMEHEIDETKSLVLQSSQAAEQAKAAVAQNAAGAAGQVGRAPEAAQPARPGQDAGADEHGHGLARRDRGRGRPQLRRDPRQDRGPLRQGQGRGRAHRRGGRRPHARDRAGLDERRGPGPPGRDPHPARPGPPSEAEGAKLLEQAAAIDDGAIGTGRRPTHRRRAGHRSGGRPPSPTRPDPTHRPARSAPPPPRWSIVPDAVRVRGA